MRLDISPGRRRPLSMLLGGVFLASIAAACSTPGAEETSPERVVGNEGALGEGGSGGDPASTTAAGPGGQNQGGQNQGGQNQGGQGGWGTGGGDVLDAKACIDADGWAPGVPWCIATFKEELVCDFSKINTTELDTCIDSYYLREQVCWPEDNLPQGDCAAMSCCYLPGYQDIDCRDYCVQLGQGGGTCVETMTYCGQVQAMMGACVCETTPPPCGDGYCDTSFEDWQSCSADCDGCGDGACTGDEDCDSCSTDCGGCGAGGAGGGTSATGAGGASTTTTGAGGAGSTTSGAGGASSTTTGAGGDTTTSGQGGFGPSGSGQGGAGGVGQGGQNAGGQGGNGGSGGGGLIEQSCMDADGWAPGVRWCTATFQTEGVCDFNFIAGYQFDQCVDATHVRERSCAPDWNQPGGACGSVECCVIPTYSDVDCVQYCQSIGQAGGHCVEALTTCDVVQGMMGACECDPILPPCGDGHCDTSFEDWQSCPADCDGCGDGECTGGEDCESCSTDCGGCGAGGGGGSGATTSASGATGVGGGASTSVTSGAGGSGSSTTSGAGGSSTTSTTTGGVVCGDQVCDGAGGETCETCMLDCGACTWCGDAMCNGTETCGTCEMDCGPCTWCGDDTCNGTETCDSCPSDCGPCEWCGNGNCGYGESCGGCPSDCGACSCGGDAPPFGGMLCGRTSPCAVTTHELVDTITAEDASVLGDGPSITLDDACAAHIVHPAVGGTYASRAGGSWSVSSTPFAFVAGSLFHGPGDTVELVTDEPGGPFHRGVSSGTWSGASTINVGCTFQDRSVTSYLGTAHIGCGWSILSHGPGWWVSNSDGPVLGISSLAMSPDGHVHRVDVEGSGEALFWQAGLSAAALPSGAPYEHALAVAPSDAGNPYGRPFVFAPALGTTGIHVMALIWGDSWAETVFEDESFGPACPLPVPGATCVETQPGTRILRAFAGPNGEVRLLYAKGNYTFTRSASCTGAGYCTWSTDGVSSAGELRMAAIEASNPTNVTTSLLATALLPLAADVEVDAAGRIHVALMTYAGTPTFDGPISVGLEVRYLVMGP